MKIEIEQQDPRPALDLERDLELVIASFTSLSQSITAGDTSSTHSMALDLKHKMKNLEVNVDKMGGDVDEEAELNSLILRYEQENRELNQRVSDLEAKAEKAQQVLKSILKT